jgi:hypothetical protein
VTTDKPSVLGLCVRDKVPVVVYWTGRMMSSKGEAR